MLSFRLSTFSFVSGKGYWNLHRYVLPAFHPSLEASTSQRQNSALHIEAKHASGMGSKMRPERLLIEQVKVFAPAVEMIQRAGKAGENENRVSIN